MEKAGYAEIQVPEEAFKKDLKMEQAVGMLERLQKLGKDLGRGFGIKLTNTLGIKNHKSTLPGQEMYLSGRAAFSFVDQCGQGSGREVRPAHPYVLLRGDHRSEYPGRDGSRDRFRDHLYRAPKTRGLPAVAADGEKMGSEPRCPPMGTWTPPSWRL
jgi:hypothetical protein